MTLRTGPPGGSSFGSSFTGRRDRTSTLADPPMSPAARTWTIATAVAIAALAIGLYLGGHPSSLPGVLRNAFVSSSVSVRTQLENEIQNDFYRPVSKKQLETASLSGIVDSLKDPYSKYFTPAE